MSDITVTVADRVIRVTDGAGRVVATVREDRVVVVTDVPAATSAAASAAEARALFNRIYLGA